jgi:hypothetical protein
MSKILIAPPHTESQCTQLALMRIKAEELKQFIAKHTNKHLTADKDLLKIHEKINKRLARELKKYSFLKGTPVKYKSPITNETREAKISEAQYFSGHTVIVKILYKDQGFDCVGLNKLIF